MTWIRITDPICFLGGPIGPCCYDCGGEMGHGLTSRLYVATQKGHPEDGCELICGDCIKDSEAPTDA